MNKNLGQWSYIKITMSTKSVMSIPFYFFSDFKVNSALSPNVQLSVYWEYWRILRVVLLVTLPWESEGVGSPKALREDLRPHFPTIKLNLSQIKLCLQIGHKGGPQCCYLQNPLLLSQDKTAHRPWTVSRPFNIEGYIAS